MKASWDFFFLKSVSLCIDLICSFSLLYSILSLKYIPVYFSHSSFDGHLRFVGFLIKPEQRGQPFRGCRASSRKAAQVGGQSCLGTRKPHAPGQQREQKGYGGVRSQPRGRGQNQGGGFRAGGLCLGCWGLGRKQVHSQGSGQEAGGLEGLLNEER